ncbi:hypothetical protein BT69DRAFT_1355170 [Atractiella rhizophila]|nr:hypothetical protein BT69DRAFT_1355170 [Atractiella rhizophila]
MVLRFNFEKICCQKAGQNWSTSFIAKDPLGDGSAPSPSKTPALPSRHGPSHRIRNRHRHHRSDTPTLATLPPSDSLPLSRSVTSISLHPSFQPPVNVSDNLLEQERTKTVTQKRLGSPSSVVRPCRDLEERRDKSEERMVEAVELANPDVILAPFLSRRVPRVIWENDLILVLHVSGHPLNPNPFLFSSPPTSPHD